MVARVAVALQHRVLPVERHLLPRFPQDAGGNEEEHQERRHRGNTRTRSGGLTGTRALLHNRDGGVERVERRADVIVFFLSRYFVYFWPGAPAKRPPNVPMAERAPVRRLFEFFKNFEFFVFSSSSFSSFLVPYATNKRTFRWFCVFSEGIFPKQHGSTGFHPHCSSRPAFIVSFVAHFRASVATIGTGNNLYGPGTSSCSFIPISTVIWFYQQRNPYRTILKSLPLLLVFFV